MPDIRRRWTTREVRALIAANPLQTPRYELVDGDLLVTSSPSYVHQAAVAEMLVRLRLYLATQPGVGRAIPSPSDVELEPESLTQPDILVLPEREVRRQLVEGLPIRELVLAIEVISPSSGRHDRVKKRPLYQRHESEYWIVDLDARMFERWRAGDGRPDQIVDTLTWLPGGATEPFQLDLPAHFAEVFGEK